MNINYITGDATNPTLGNDPKFIFHVVNNQGGWGAGFVLAISKKWKIPESEYRRWATKKFYNTPFELGEILTTEIPNQDIKIVHLLAQNGYASVTNPQPLDYKALETCLFKAYDHVRWWKGSVHMPKIGSGLGGGKWDIIEDIIKTTSYSKTETFIYTL